VQNDIGNKYSPTVIVAAITSKISKARLPTHIEVRAGECGLEKDSVILAEQLRTIDKRRLKERMGVIAPEGLLKVDDALLMSIGLAGRELSY
jgi:mRNA interferase MazF